jgi:hypothetical protein
VLLDNDHTTRCTQKYIYNRTHVHFLGLRLDSRWPYHREDKFLRRDLLSLKKAILEEVFQYFEWWTALDVAEKLRKTTIPET